MSKIFPAITGKIPTELSRKSFYLINKKCTAGRESTLYKNKKASPGTSGKAIQGLDKYLF